MIRIIKAINRRIKMRTDPVAYARSLGVRVGHDCRLDLAPDTFGSEPYLISIGNHVTIAPNVKFINHDGGVWVFRKDHPDIDVVAPIVICDNVFIGMNCILLPGITIGANSVVGAGSIVTRDVEPGSVVVGAPAKRIKSVDDYWERVRPKAMMIRGLSPDEKRRHLENLFQEKMAEGAASSHPA
ncbi:acyltransferase [Singulisphaera rosea]